MHQRLKLAIDRKFTSVRDVLDYIDTHFYGNTSLDSLEQMVQNLTNDEKKEVIEKIIKIRNRRMTSKL
jgi:disulfide oxidoreductase YuzD